MTDSGGVAIVEAMEGSRLRIRMVVRPEDPMTVLDGEAEAEWLPLLGPTAWLVLRAIAWRQIMDAEVPVATIGRWLGVPPGRIRTALRRLEQFGWVQWTDDDVWIRTSCSKPRRRQR